MSQLRVLPVINLFKSKIIISIQLVIILLNKSTLLFVSTNSIEKMHGKILIIFNLCSSRSVQEQFFLMINMEEMVMIALLVNLFSKRLKKDKIFIQLKEKKKDVNNLKPKSK